MMFASSGRGGGFDVAARDGETRTAGDGVGDAEEQERAVLYRRVAGWSSAAVY